MQTWNLIFNIKDNAAQSMLRDKPSRNKYNLRESRCGKFLLQRNISNSNASTKLGWCGFHLTQTASNIIHQCLFLCFQTLKNWLQIAGNFSKRQLLLLQTFALSMDAHNYSRVSNSCNQEGNVSEIMRTGIGTKGSKWIKTDWFC